MIGAVWKLIIFTSMANRSIYTSINERVTLQLYCRGVTLTPHPLLMQRSKIE